MNLQIREKRAQHGPSTVDVHSMFETIQGEGPFNGLRAFFIRLAGCNLQCPGCDTEYTQGRERWPVSRVTECAAMSKCELVVITGGEPFRQDISSLCKSLINAGKNVQIETNGSLAPSSEFMQLRTLLRAGNLSVVCSPKAGKVHDYIRICVRESRFGAWKYIIDADDGIDETNGLPRLALHHPASPTVWHVPREEGRGRTYVQPMDVGNATDGRNTLNVQLCIRSVQQFGHRLCLQTHKFIGVP